MTRQTENDKKIQRFFFGEMAEDERFEFEREFAVSPELLEEMRAFEADLIEKYVRGWMNPAEKSGFERNFLNTGKRREKVEFSRQLIRELRPDAALQDNERQAESIRSRFARLFSAPKFALGTAVFVIFITIFGGWFLMRNPELEKVEIAKNRNSAETANPDRNTNSNVEIDTVNSNQARAANLETDSAKDPVKSPEPVNTPEPKKTAIPKTAPNPVLTLFAGTLRSSGKINELNLPENTGGATFRLNLKTVDYKQFQAEITDGNGKPVFRSGNLTPRKSILNLFVPAKNLPKGDYRIEIYGRNAAGEYESAADFQFRVN